MASEFFVLHHDDIKVLEIVEGRVETLDRIKEVIGEFDDESKKLTGRFIEKDDSLFDCGYHLKSFTLRGTNRKASHIYLGDKK